MTLAKLCVFIVKGYLEIKKESLTVLQTAQTLGQGKCKKSVLSHSFYLHKW